MDRPTSLLVSIRTSNTPHVVLEKRKRKNKVAQKTPCKTSLRIDNNNVRPVTGEPMNEIPPGNDNRPKSWAQLGIGAQFGIALSLVAVGLLSSWLGLDAGLGSSFRDSIISSLVGDGQIFFNGGDTSCRCWCDLGAGLSCPLLSGLTKSLQPTAAPPLGLRRCGKSQRKGIRR